jgi:hypothetical protein
MNCIAFMKRIQELLETFVRRMGDKNTVTLLLEHKAELHADDNRALREASHWSQRHCSQTS